MELEFNLDAILEKKKISMSQAAKDCELSYPTIFNMVNNKTHRISLLTIEKLCNGLNVKYAEIFREKEK